VSKFLAFLYIYYFGSVCNLEIFVILSCSRGRRWNRWGHSTSDDGVMYEGLALFWRKLPYYRQHKVEIRKWRGSSQSVLKRATSCNDPLHVGIKYLFWKGSQYFRHFGRLTSPISVSPTPVLFLYPPVQSRPAPCSYATPPALICTLDLTCTLITNSLTFTLRMYALMRGGRGGVIFESTCTFSQRVPRIWTARAVI
jgi:hypothetical protein